ncbi:LysR family transcriptional regulator [Pseudohoeflea coraliihabitans]|uniref:LysR family transcriptional regulator n=1 Tax=Pseudohoeflea coraliihabitans TaxID=2860393 RepID=A0ABS6WQX5_9HYPH|nr:LysR family transcriptional regulator [Pseudohoeflea sp. DP4N28-3]MBW3098379.1 LysR family transcriptional regulator [Pseudohoeflea sp. DP4N28-3]
MIDKLEFFLVLARERHFGRAAEALGITQPTLSAALRQLEDQLGVSLVERGSRYRGLTPEGQRVLEWARRIVSDAHTMRAEMRAAHHGLSGLARLAIIPTASAMISEITTALAAAHPDLRLSVTTCTSAEIIARIENFEIDAGVTYLDRHPEGRIVTVPLYAERYQLITARQRPLAARQSVSWAEVAREPLCLLTPDMQNRRIIDQHLAEAGQPDEPTLQSNSMIVLLKHVATGAWSSVMPINLAETLGAGEAIRAVPIVEPDAAHRVGMVALEREPHPPIVSALLHQARVFAEKHHS